MFSQSVHDAFQKYATSWLEFSRPYDEEDFERICENVTRLYRMLGRAAPQIVPLRGPIQQIVFPCLIELMLRYGQEETKSHNFEPVTESYVVRKEWRVIWKEALHSLDWKQLSSIESIGVLLNQQIRARIHDDLCTDAKLDVESEIGLQRMEQIEEMATNSLHNALLRVYDVLIQNTSGSRVYKSFSNRLPEDWARRTKKIKKAGFTHFETITHDWISAAEFYWLATYHFSSKQLKARISEDINNELNIWVELFLNATAFLFCENICFVYLKPTEAYLDDRFRFHHPNNAALRFIDGSEYHRWHGIPIPDDIVDNPKRLKFDRIMAESNGEVRRALIEMYGFEKFISHSFPRKVHEDEYGTLYRHELPGDEPLMAVKVVNSTPEPDGTYKEYFLRVPPGTRTAKEGVAWSFNLRPSEYHPKEES